MYVYTASKRKNINKFKITFPRYPDEILGIIILSIIRMEKKNYVCDSIIFNMRNFDDVSSSVLSTAFSFNVISPKYSGTFLVIN